MMIASLVVTFLGTGRINIFDAVTYQQVAFQDLDHTVVYMNRQRCGVYLLI